MKKICILTLALACCIAVRAQAGRVYTVAVADFDAKNMSGYDSMAISEFFRGGMVNAGVCRIINRNNMETVLAEQKFQMSGCTDQDCVVKMGKLLNAEKIISGSIVSFNDEYYINAKVIDVETGEIQYSEQIKCKDKTEMPKKAEELAWVVSEKISKKKPMLRDTFDQRKKFAVYTTLLTPYLYIPESSSLYRGIISGIDVTEKINKVNFPQITYGFGLKVFPWKNICLDICKPNMFSQNVEINEVAWGSPLQEYDSQMVFEIDSYIANLCYISNFENKMNYSIGVGAIKTTIDLKAGRSFWVKPGNNISSIYFANIGIDYKIQEYFSFSLDMLYFMSKYDSIAIGSVHSNLGTEILQIKPETPTTFKLSISYYFNF